MTAFFLVVSGGYVHAQHQGVWKDDSSPPSHNFYIQHYATGSTVVVYTRDAQAFHAFVAEMTENAFDAPSLNPMEAPHLSIEFQDPGYGRAEIRETASDSAPSNVFDIVKAFPAVPSEHAGIWKDESHKFSMYVQEYESGFAVILYSFDAVEFQAFVNPITEGHFQGWNLAGETERMEVQFTGPDSGLVSVTPGSELEGLYLPGAGNFTYNVFKMYAPSWGAEPETVVISGFVFTVSGASEGMSDVMVAFGDAGSTFTNEEGRYSMEVPSGWTGTLAPSREDYRFEPPSREFTNVTTPQHEINFQGIPENGGTFYSISGTVTVGAPPVPLDHVPIQLSNGVSVVTDSSGMYSVSAPEEWSGTITPSLAGHVFDPASITLTNVNQDLTGQDFWAPQPQDPTVSGSVYLFDIILGSIPQIGVTISFSSLGSVTTGSQGTYGRQVTYGWSGTVTPSVIGCAFDPPNLTFSKVRFDRTDQDFRAICSGSKLVYVSGKVTDKVSGTPVPGIELSFGSAGSTQTDGRGEYKYAVGLGWSGTVTPSKPGCSSSNCRFAPASRSYNNLTADQTAQDYIITRSHITISGTVWTDRGGQNFVFPLPDVVVSYRGGSDTTDKDGRYSLEIPYNAVVTLTPSKSGFSFTPQERKHTDTYKDWAEQDFTATCISSSCAYR